MGYFGVLSASAGLAVAVVFELAPAFDAKDPLLLQADVFKVAVVALVAWTVFLETHWIINYYQFESPSRIALFIWNDRIEGEIVVFRSFFIRSWLLYK